MKEVGTLKELGVQVGDVLQWVGGERFPCTISAVTSTYVYMNTPGGKVEYSFEWCDHPWEVISRASETPKLWRDMTPEEKGALLLAAHEGKVIENSLDGVNWIAAKACWADDYAYRIKPEPKVEIVTNTEMYITARGSIVSNAKLDGAKPVKLTYTKFDGVIDLDSYKLEYR